MSEDPIVQKAMDQIAGRYPRERYGESQEEIDRLRKELSQGDLSEEARLALQTPGMLEEYLRLARQELADDEPGGEQS
jgi:hypothetical protein